MPNPISTTDTWSTNENAIYAPFTPRRTFELTIDDPEATNNEAFWAISADFDPADAPAIIAVISGHDSGAVNPVFIPSPGVAVPCCGIGYATSGNDVHGNLITSTISITQVFAFGGKKVNAFRRT